MDIAAKITEIFKKDDRLHDTYLMKSALNNAFALYPSLDKGAQQDFCLDLKSAFLDILSGHFFKGLQKQTKTSMTEKVDSLLGAISLYPDLLTTVNAALSETADSDWYQSEESIWGEKSEIPFLDLLTRYSALTTGVEIFIKKIITDELFFPPLLKQIYGGPFHHIVTPDVMDRLCEGLIDDIDNIGNAEYLALLKTLPAYWGLFESVVTPFFCAYTPPVREDQLPEYDDRYSIGNHYYIDYDPKQRFLCIKFDHLVDRHNSLDTSWTGRTMDPDHLCGIYILLKHSLDVLNGSAGATATNPDWIANQKLYLKPALQADVTALEKQMLAKKIKPPSWQPVTPPQMNSTVWNTPPQSKGGFFPSP